MARDRIVIDSGYLLEAVLPTKPLWQREADELIECLISREIMGIVPWIFFAELAAVCSRKVRGHLLNRYEAENFLDSIQNLGLDADLQLEWPRQIFDNSMSIQTQAYDAMYIMLSQRMGGLPIATRDKGMLTGARGAKLPVYVA
jgi:predicted nucleic acid-binding protein